MKAKIKAVLVITIFIGFSSIDRVCLAQWGVAADFSLAPPITGYGEVFKIGYGFGVAGDYHFKKGFGVGFQTGFTRFSKTKESSISINEPKVTIVPLVFTAEYEMNSRKFLRPFISGGLGLSINVLSYYIDDPVKTKNDTNASFTMFPQLGVRFAFTNNFMGSVKGGYLLLMDGPPVVMENHSVVYVFPKSDQVTGYAAISLGFSYRFN